MEVIIHVTGVIIFLFLGTCCLIFFAPMIFLLFGEIEKKGESLARRIRGAK